MAAITYNTGNFTNSSYAPAYLQAVWGVSKAPGTALHTSTAATDILPSAANTCFSSVGYGKTLPAGLLNNLGNYFTLECEGTIGTTSTPNLTLAVTLTDSAATTVTLATSSAVAMQAITGVRPWTLRATFGCIATGATATLRGQGMFNYDTAALGGSFGLVSTAGADGVLTLANTIKLVATWGTSSSSNTITVTGMRILVGITNG
ncbi:MAG: hypothetical protein IPK52_22015 [Chloroflexi bacterium]|nr:hypothetical protein [Chloroflexota bacterium]